MDLWLLFFVACFFLLASNYSICMTRIITADINTLFVQLFFESICLFFVLLDLQGAVRQ